MFSISSPEYNDYCDKHPDLADGLEYNQAIVLNQYMSQEMSRKLDLLKAKTDGAVTYLGVNRDWPYGAQGVSFKTSMGTAKYSELQRFFPTKHTVIKQMFASIYSEISYICYINREGLTEAWRSENEQDANKIYSSDFKSDEFSICKQFYRVGLPIPMSYVNEYEKAHRYVFKDLRLKEFYKQAGEEDYESFRRSGILFFDAIEKGLADGSIPTNNSKKLAQLAVLMNLAVVRNLARGMTLQELSNVPYMTVYKTSAENGVRTATKREVETLPPQTFSEELMLFKTKSHYEMLEAFCWLCTGDNKILKRVTKFGENIVEMLNNQRSLLILEAIMEYMSSSDFEKDLDYALEYKKEFQYPDGAEDEIIEESFLDKCEYAKVRTSEFLISKGYKLGSITFMKKPPRNVSYIAMVYDIAQRTLTQYKKGRGINLSDRQRDIITSYCEKEKLRLSSTNNPNYFTREIELKIKDMISWYNYPSNHWDAKFFGSILSKERISEKQLKIVEERYDKYLADRGLTQEITSNNKGATGETESGASTLQTIARPAITSPDMSLGEPEYKPFSFEDDTYTWEEG